MVEGLAGVLVAAWATMWAAASAWQWASVSAMASLLVAELDLVVWEVTSGIL